MVPIASYDVSGHTNGLLTQCGGTFAPKITVKPSQKTASGIYIPEKNQEKLNIANVIAVGPGVTNQNGELVKVSVNAGDKVLIPPYGGANVKVGDEEYLMFRDSDLLAKIEE
ncbi:hypothetical protein KL942_004708 [Ogataea angusta]|uniref:Uncharacterized protein n=1 Tax=Pichia angusta TaxID=870730 RepID=A0ABQ7RSD4_PICAN|nr:hypothetical protein KL942_004708 [Ogataea angusta]KAG7846482.1 hypothetical protein KL940_004434 [Ogataea angusta]KAG7854703.1 hypothetical protein KL919_004985 [Ogataea angusta]